MRHRHRSAGHKQPERGKQRPHVRLPAMAERMRGIRRAAGPPVRDQQEDLVAGISPRMRGLSHQGRRPGHHGGGGLRHRDQHVGAESDQDRRETFRRARIAQQRHRAKQVKGPAVDTSTRRRRRWLTAALLARHPPVLTHHRRRHRAQSPAAGGSVAGGAAAADPSAASSGRLPAEAAVPLLPWTCWWPRMVMPRRGGRTLAHAGYAAGVLAPCAVARPA